MKLNAAVLLALLEIWLADFVNSQSSSSPATTTAPVDDSSSGDNFVYARTHGKSCFCIALNLTTSYF